MNTLFALLTTAFSFVLYPVKGGEITVVRQTPTVEIMVDLNGDPTCTAALTSDEALSMSEVMINIMEDGASGKTVNLGSGGWIAVSNVGGGDMRLSTSGGSACSVSLQATEREPDQVLDALLDAATL